MESHEVMREAVTGVGAKSVAADMTLSQSLIYKWCEPKDAPGSGGAENPLDRIEKIFRLTEDPGPIQWLCEKAGGFFVQNPQPQEADNLPLLIGTQKILQEFSDLLDAVSRSVEDDGKVDAKEAERIRREWEALKRTTESFVVACEHGEHDNRLADHRR